MRFLDFGQTSLTWQRLSGPCLDATRHRAEHAETARSWGDDLSFGARLFRMIQRPMVSQMKLAI
ncbi:MAG TPA: hypothetical protein DCM67_02130 [Propionibacteriaceae bacterium]|nr:hypothetical protein [Propionibacteriaceae bacterium]